MESLIWLGTTALSLACFAYFMYMLYKVRDVSHYNYLTALLGTIFLIFSIFSLQSFLGGATEPFEFTAIFLLLILALLQVREEVLGHAFR